MINLNLYTDGKVCLSLLGTWFAGDTIGNWRPGISTILQRLLSIRAMISVSDSLSQNAPIDLGTFPPPYFIAVSKLKQSGSSC